MMRIRKALSLALVLVFMLIGMFLCQNLHALRVPIDGHKTMKKALGDIGEEGKLRTIAPEKTGGYATTLCTVEVYELVRNEDTGKVLKVPIVIGNHWDKNYQIPESMSEIYREKFINKNIPITIQGVYYENNDGYSFNLKIRGMSEQAIRGSMVTRCKLNEDFVAYAKSKGFELPIMVNSQEGLDKLVEFMKFLGIDFPMGISVKFIFDDKYGGGIDYMSNKKAIRIYDGGKTWWIPEKDDGKRLIVHDFMGIIHDLFHVGQEIALVEKLGNNVLSDYSHPNELVASIASIPQDPFKIFDYERVDIFQEGDAERSTNIALLKLDKRHRPQNKGLFKKLADYRAYWLEAGIIIANYFHTKGDLIYKALPVFYQHEIGKKILMVCDLIFEDRLNLNKLVNLEIPFDVFGFLERHQISLPKKSVKKVRVLESSI